MTAQASSPTNLHDANFLLSTALGAAGVLVEHNSSTAKSYNDGFYPGNDTVIFTVPYTYSQVMSVIGSFKNLTWSGNPDDTVTLNGTDKTVGTARTYEIVGAHVVETLKTYSKPPNGPYYENHALDLVTIPSANLSVYADIDASTVTPICNGAASTFNFTIDFCANNAPAAAAVLHMIHMTDAQTVGKFLGGQNFSSCAALSNATATSTSTPPIETANAATANMASISTLALIGGGLLAWFGL